MAITSAATLVEEVSDCVMARTIVPGLVSVIIPVHNRAALLREAVASVLEQTHRPIEIIVVDDGSTDDTPGAVNALKAEHPNEIVALHQRNAGPGFARELGRQAARGEFIQYLDSDDILLPRKFEWQIAGLRQYPDCGVAYGKTYYRASELPSERHPWKRTGERIETMFPAFLRSRLWGTSTPLYRRSLTDSAGPWLPFRSEEDWEYDCRIAAMGTRLFFVDEFVSEEREHSGPRLSRGGTTSVEKLRDRAKAHALILAHALQWGVQTEDEEMQHYARELFLLSRQCGAAGLAVESRDLFDYARKASGSIRAKGIDFKLYRIAASILGWSLTGRLACSADRLRK
jgi:glycosyltransferase involved in cell wall biosynthesis